MLLCLSKLSQWRSCYGKVAKPVLEKPLLVHAWTGYATVHLACPVTAEHLISLIWLQQM